MLLLWSADLKKITFSNNSFKNTIKVSNSFVPDQNPHSIGPGLGSNCLQRLSTDGKSSLGFIFFKMKQNLLRVVCCKFCMMFYVLT